MKLEAEHGVYLALAAVVCVFFVLFAFMGPVGWVLDVLLVLAVIKLADWSGLFPGPPERPPKRNCSECGARNASDADSCEYCGEPLSDA